METSLECLTPRRRHLDNIDPETVLPRLPDPGAGRGQNTRFELRSVAGEPQMTMRSAPQPPNLD